MWPALVSKITEIITSEVVSTILVPAAISALIAIIVSFLTISQTKKKEREAIWRAKKLSYYEEFVSAASGMVGEQATSDAKNRFADSMNKLHLIATADVISALHKFAHLIEKGDPHNRHDELWSKLLWEIRSDLDAPRLNALTTSKHVCGVPTLNKRLTHTELNTRERFKHFHSNQHRNSK